MKTVKLCDGSFTNHSFGFAGMNVLQRPEYFEWDRTPGTGKVKVFTDAKLDRAKDDKSYRKVALLIECRTIRPEIYELSMHKHFDAVLTHDRELCGMDRPYLFMPFGGSWIDNWGANGKTKDVSIILSAKRSHVGHRIRHEVATWDLDAYGAGVRRWVDDKREALADYRYSVVIENARHDWYFTEKLIDCLSQETVPLYWGCPSIRDFFDMRGIIQCDTLDQLRYELKKTSPEDYEKRLPGVRENLKRACEFWCPEDWVWRRYPGLLE